MLLIRLSRHGTNSLSVNHLKLLSAELQAYPLKITICILNVWSADTCCPQSNDLNVRYPPSSLNNYQVV